VRFRYFDVHHTRLFLSFLIAGTMTLAVVVSASAAPKKKPPQTVDEIDSLDSEDDALEKELQQIETDEFKDLDAAEKAKPAPPVEEAAQAEPQDLVEEAKPEEQQTVEESAEESADEEDLLLDESEEPAPKVAQPKTAPLPPEPNEEPPAPEIQEEPAPPVVEQAPPPAEPEIVAKPAPEVYEDDTPDSEFETRLKNIYQQFYAQPISDEEWMGVVGERGSETYEVQRGDTLWGISVTFFGNGFFWPKLWQLNSAGITNPHEINVGDKIVFSMGNLGQEPEIRVARESDEEVIVKETENSESPTKVVVPGRRKFRPVLETLPPSIPEILREDSKYDDSGFAISAVRSPKIPDPFPITGLLTDEPPSVDGEIVDVETGGRTASLFQHVFIRLKRGGVGDIFSAFIVRKALGGGVIFGGGVPIEYQGELEVTQKVSSDLYKATIISNFDQIDIGARLTSGPMPEAELSKKGRVSNAETKILGGPLDDSRKLFGLHSIVYLDGGTKKGILAGDILTVLRQDSLRVEVVNPPPTAKIGRVKVLNVSKSFSTGVVIESGEDIRVGDRTGSIAEVE
jgi:nucleoid-associated protein YgaU